MLWGVGKCGLWDAGAQICRKFARSDESDVS